MAWVEKDEEMNHLTFINRMGARSGEDLKGGSERWNAAGMDGEHLEESISDTGNDPFQKRSKWGKWDPVYGNIVKHSI